MIAFLTEIRADPPILTRGAPGDANGVLSVEQSPFSDRQKLTHWIRFVNNQGREVTLWKDRRFDQPADGSLLAVDVGRVAFFWWLEGSPRIAYEPASEFTRLLVEYWLLHLVLPIYFACQGRYLFIHAGAVEIQERAILFAADSFGGKSTLTDFFVREGHALISDDKVAICELEGSFHAVPSYPYQRTYRKHEDLGHFVTDFCRGPRILQGVYELERANSESRVEIVELQGIESFASLHYAKDIALSFLRERSFEQLARIAGAVPVYRVTIPWDKGRLGEVYGAIVEHAQGVAELGRKGA